MRPTPLLHFDTDLRWLDPIIAWARRTPRVVRVWIFGSRATGLRRPKPDAAPIPDLDVAYELGPGRGDETAYSYSFHRNGRWQAELQALIPVALDLQYSMTDDAEAMVPLFVQAGGVLIYERSEAAEDEKSNSFLW